MGGTTCTIKVPDEEKTFEVKIVDRKQGKTKTETNLYIGVGIHPDTFCVYQLTILLSVEV